MYSLTKFLLICYFFVGTEIIQAQANGIRDSEEWLAIDGSEKSNNQNPKVISVNSTNYSSPEFGDVFTYNFHNITDIKTGYDYQSNGSTQEVWYDLNNDLLHSIFTNSQDPISPWADRTTKYFFSADLGVTWMELGNVPNDGSRSGFPAISGLSTGAVVLTNHSNTGGGSTRSQIFIDSGPGEFNLTTYDPGVPVPGGPSTIWPGITSTLNDNVVLVSSMNAFPKFAATNTLYLPVGTFSGWSEYRGGNAETYSLSISENGKIGHAFIGGDESDEGDIFYRESVNNGITWSTPLKIFDATPEISDTGYGALRGVSCNFYGENPAVVGYSYGTCNID